MVETAEEEKLYIYFYEGYLDKKQVWDFMDLSVRGGSAYKKGVDSEGSEIFQRHRKESDEQAEERCGRSSVLNYCRFIVDRWMGYSTKKRASRAESADKDWKLFLKDATGEGASLDQFMRAAQGDAVVTSPVWLRIDNPSVKVSSLKEQRELGLRPLASRVDPRNVVDFSLSPRDEVERVVIREEFRSKPSALVQEGVDVVFTEWTKDAWIKYTQIDEPGDTGSVEVEVLDAGLNPWGIVPFVPLHFGKPDSGLPVFSPSAIHDVADWQRDVFRVFSLLMEEWFNRTFSTTVIAGATPDEIHGQIKTTLLVLKNEKAKVVPTGADTQQAASLLDGLHFLIRNLFRVAQFESSGDPKESRTAESGEKRARDLEGLYQVLAGFAASTERAENQLIRVWAKLANKSESDTYAASSYPKDFDIQTIQEDLAQLAEMALQDFPGVFINELKLSLIRKLRPMLPEKTLQLIQSDLEQTIDHEAEDDAAA